MHQPNGCELPVRTGDWYSSDYFAKSALALGFRALGCTTYGSGSTSSCVLKGRSRPFFVTVDGKYGRADYDSPTTRRLVAR